jgi:hypothetical protein
MTGWLGIRIIRLSVYMSTHRQLFQCELALYCNFQRKHVGLVECGYHHSPQRYALA